MRLFLYIGDKQVDLDEKSFILMNFTMEDTDNPAIVRNSFSKQIKLKGTPRNNEVFSHIYRSDHITTDSSFNAMVKTPFTLYNELSEVVESGYIHLDDITLDGNGQPEYNVTFYGGLGSFFYSLSYDAEGNRRSLADLDFLAGGEDELDFTINKDSVKAAWTRIKTRPASISQLWDVLNFAPAYNGIPTQDFSANKAIVNASSAGLTTSQSGYTTKSGMTLVSLTESHTEWEVKDLRSYFQRPVVSVKAVMEAISNPDNNGGYEVEWDNFTNDPYFKDAWMTLPLLNTINGMDGRIEAFYDLPTDRIMSSDYILNVPVTPAPSNKEMSVDVDFRPTIGRSSAPICYLGFWSVANGKVYANAMLMQVIGYNSSNQVVSASEVHSFQSEVKDTTMTTAQIMSALSYTATGSAQAGPEHIGFFHEEGEWSESIHMSVTGANIAKVGLRIAVGCIRNDFTTGTNAFKVFYDEEQEFTSVGTALGRLADYRVTAGEGGTGIGVVYYGPSVLRSGGLVHKRDLLTGEKTPAEYLISYAKMFGLKFCYDKTTKKVSIMQRKNFFRNNVVDLTKRVDLSRERKITPVIFSKKWYLFTLPHRGEWADYYRTIYANEYGQMRVDTNNQFNADSQSVMDGNAFSGAAEVLERGRYYNTIVKSGKTIPSVFVDGGKYLLYSSAGATLELNITPVGTDATITYKNTKFNGYDAISKAQFHDADQKSYDERDTLLLFLGTDTTGAYSDYALTDDTSLMMQMNENVPCWNLNAAQEHPSDAVGSIYPMFGRDMVTRGTIVNSLEFGSPKEYCRPDIKGVNSNAFVYGSQWRSFLVDQFNVDTSRMTCHVDLSGMQVGEEMLRDFYWFDDSLWMLNRIVDHSITTIGTTQCEFIKVMDRNNYLR